MHTFRPLDFQFSKLINSNCIAISRNVASTRIVLGQGHTGNDAAGQIINRSFW